MPRIVYIGPLPSVDVPHARLAGVDHGVPVDVPDPWASSLLEQVDNWAPDGSEAAKPALARAAAARKADRAVTQAAPAAGTEG